MVRPAGLTAALPSNEITRCRDTGPRLCHPLAIHGQPSGLLRADVALHSAFRLRIILHGFGTVWRDATNTERAELSAEESERFNARWDAFLAAHIEHFCGCDGLEAPAWTCQSIRCLKHMWWSTDYFDFERGGVMVTTPAAFEAHGVWIAERYLLVV